jgi:hypothetical protein
LREGGAGGFALDDGKLLDEHLAERIILGHEQLHQDADRLGSGSPAR